MPITAIGGPDDEGPRGEIERASGGHLPERLPPLAVSRVTEHIEEDLAYRFEFTTMRGLDIAGRLSDGVAELHQKNAARRGDDPVLEQFHRRIEATITMAGCEGLAVFMEHVSRETGR